MFLCEISVEHIPGGAVSETFVGTEKVMGGFIQCRDGWGQFGRKKDQ